MLRRVDSEPPDQAVLFAGTTAAGGVAAFGQAEAEYSERVSVIAQ